MKRYDSYKPSGISWIGEIPSHWKTTQLREFLSLVSEKGHPCKQLLSVTRENGVIIRNIDSKEENHNFIPEDLSGYKLVKQGQFAINKMKSWQGSYGVSPYEGIVSPAYYVCDLRFDNKLFFSWAIRSNAYVPFFTQMSKGIRVDQWDLSTNALKEIPFFLPTPHEQKKIVDYLTTKTSQINAQVADRDREIQLLNELKQAEIANVVTRGLNPDVPMKDSGIVGFGAIPEHWEVRDISRLFDFQRGVTFTKDLIEEHGNPVLTYGQVHSKLNNGFSINENLIKFIPDQIVENKEKSICSKGDFIFADTSEDIDGCGNCIYIDKNMGIYAGYHTFILRPKDKSEYPYFAYLFKSHNWRAQLRLQCNEVKVYSITQSSMRRCKVVLPPIEEQRAIVEYIEKKNTAIDDMIANLKAEIEFLTEYKQRLIADAVTGQIKVD